MNLGRIAEYLPNQPQLTLYLKLLKDSIQQINIQINQQKIKTRQLMFNISTLCGLSTSRNKIQEQMDKFGIVIPPEPIFSQEVNDSVSKILENSKIPQVLNKISLNYKLKRKGPDLEKKDQVLPKKKRKVQSQKLPEINKKRSSQANQNGNFKGNPKEDSNKNLAQIQNKLNQNSSKQNQRRLSGDSVDQIQNYDE